MKTAIKEIKGNWDLGYTLDKHMISSTYLGDDEHGHPRFDNQRTEVGEATYQLKNKHKESEAAPLAQAIFDNVFLKFKDVHVIIPMAASTARSVQPVDQVAAALAGLTELPWYKGWLIKAQGGKKLKDIPEADRSGAVKGTISLAGDLDEEGKVNILLLDDLYQSGASVNEACAVLRAYAKIGKIYFVALTRKH
jgi:predicted amidophosphoribosyltransferase